MAGILEYLDHQLEQLFASWNLWSSFLVALVAIVLLYPLLTYKEPDTHPLILARQSNVSMVRMPGESAVYRSIEVPHGLPLKTGLNVKQEGQGRWMPGRDGDLRDVWLRVVHGTLADDGKATGRKAAIKTVYGREEVETHDTEVLTKQINAIGRYVQEKSATSLAICLPNSVELLLVIFAAAFYGFHPVLIPYGLSQDTTTKLISASNANTVISQAGSIPLADIKAQCRYVKLVISVVEKTSRHMDWNEDDDKVHSEAWHDIVKQSSGATQDSLPGIKDVEARGITTVWMNEGSTSGEMVTFTQQNMVAAAAAQISALPIRHRLTHEDLFLPADNMTQAHILTQTLAALYSGTSLALNSVAGPDVDLASAAMGVSPTVMAVSAKSVVKLHEATRSTITGSVQKYALNTQKQALHSGYMPPSKIASGVIQPTRTTLGKIPNKLRLLYIYEKANGGLARLSSDTMSELRAFTGARVIYGLTAPKIAGTITQTQFYDYRKARGDSGAQSHVGAPVSCLEVKLLDNNTHKNMEGENPIGELRGER
ncbi:MAG: hypothetical protein Q9159_002645 [Coniocarpon cinnabarinum]